MLRSYDTLVRECLGVFPAVAQLFEKRGGALPEVDGRGADGSRCVAQFDRNAYHRILTAVGTGAFHHHLTVLKEGLRVMDSTAISLSMENNLSIIVFSMMEPGNLVRIIQGEAVGTIVK